MLKFKNVDIFGFAAAMRGMRNPKRDKDHPNLNDGHHCWEYDECEDCPAYDLEKGVCRIKRICTDDFYVIGPKDLDLALRLNYGGPEHSKYRRMIQVWVDITGPLYWWKEFDTYKIGTVANSTSTMHMITKSPIVIDDFSIDGLSDDALARLSIHIDELNSYRKRYLNAEEWIKTHQDQTTRTDDQMDYWIDLRDKAWRNLILRLPTNYNQTRTVCLNYETLANIYRQRAWHKLTEWKVDFIGFIKKLPYQELITGVDLDGNKIL